LSAHEIFESQLIGLALHAWR